jgi:hypothetical protein
MEIPRFDIFRYEKDGSLHCCGAVETFEVAQVRVRNLM